MSCLKLHWPLPLSVYPPVDEWQTDNDGDDAAAGSEPVILSFPGIARSATRRVGAHRQRDLLTRARIIHENRCCTVCGRASVVPVDAEPALAFRDSMPVPGTGTLVGFACDCCGHEWRV